MYWLWNPDPAAIVLGNIAVGWYGILFALGLLSAWRLVIFMYHKEGKAGQDLGALLIYLMVGTIIGARLGHCLFYDPLPYFRNPLGIFTLWEGGFAGHGAAAGLLIACLIFSRRKKEQPFFWLADRIAIVAALVASLIRLGDFINADYIGTPTSEPYGVVFLSPFRDVARTIDFTLARLDAEQDTTVQNTQPGIVPVRLHFINTPGTAATAEDQSRLRSALRIALQTNPVSRIHLADPGSNDTALTPDGPHGLSMTLPVVARHPVQLYEAGLYGFLFVVLAGNWWKHRSALPHGVFLGQILVVLFAGRFVLEYLKEDVTSVESGLFLSVGQILSVPFIVFGAYLFWRLLLPPYSLSEGPTREN